MKKWLIIIICAICLICCGGGGGGSGGGGSGGGNEPSGPPIKIPAITAQGNVDYYLVRISGTLEMAESPLQYYIDGFSEGEYFCQVQAVYHEQPDYPVNFYLIVTEYEGVIKPTYEILPESWEDNFDLEHLIWP